MRSATWTCFTLAIAMEIIIAMQGFCVRSAEILSTIAMATTPKVTTTMAMPSTTVTTTLVPRSAPLSPQAAVDLLNKQYMGYDFTAHNSNNKSPLGITISFAAQSDDFNKNLYCSPEMRTGCFNGGSDCRMSASLYNWKMISKDYIWSSIFSRPTGYIFNQTMVETTLGKCSYLFDGATGNRYNNGCGNGAPGNNCSDTKCAYHNICPSTGKTCTANDPEVNKFLCQPFGPVPVPRSMQDFQCLFPGPALNWPKYDQPNHLRAMVDARMNNEIATSDYLDHNEVVIDERALIPAIWKDPAVVIPAFLYAKSQAAIGRPAAERMRDKFGQDYRAGKIPVIGVNDVSDFRPNGPFFVPGDTENYAAAVLV